MRRRGTQARGAGAYGVPRDDGEAPIGGPQGVGGGDAALRDVQEAGAPVGHGDPVGLGPVLSG